MKKDITYTVEAVCCGIRLLLGIAVGLAYCSHMSLAFGLVAMATNIFSIWLPLSIISHIRRKGAELRLPVDEQFSALPEGVLLSLICQRADAKAYMEKPYRAADQARYNRRRRMRSHIASSCLCLAMQMNVWLHAGNCAVHYMQLSASWVIAVLAVLTGIEVFCWWNGVYRPASENQKLRIAFEDKVIGMPEDEFRELLASCGIAADSSTQSE